jgi:Ca-activated chloride channel family protein
VQARKLATTPDMRGAAEYRAGDYANAAKAFAQGDDARSHYNLGNALAGQGEYGKAIAAYKEALRLDPKMADARANLDSVQDWLKEHASPPRQGRGKDRQGQRQGQSKSGSGQSQGQSQPPGSSSGSQAGDAAPTPRPPSSSGPGTSPHPDSGPGEKSRAQGGNDASGQDGSGPSASAAARQQRDAAQAAQALEREMQHARGSARSRQRGDAGTFALGQGDIDRDSRLDAQQRALLHAVPDDPGALLRRKFKLEWEQRNGQQQEDGQQ